MAYRIEYTPDSGSEKDGSWSLAIMTLLVFVLFAAVVHSFYPGQWSNLQAILLPGDGAVTGAALETLVQDLRSGIPMTDAAAAFCTQILQHAGVR